MAPGTNRRGVIAQFAVPVHERIEQFAFTAMQMASVVGEFVVGHGTGVGPCRVVVIVVLLVFGVIPGGPTEARADVLERHVQLGKDVRAVGDQALLEGSVAVVLVECNLALAQFAAGILRAPGGAVLHRVVPTQVEIRIAGVYRKGLGSLTAQHQRRGESETKGCRGADRAARKRRSRGTNHRVNLLFL
ncbi:hypothetical protein D9M71_533050 [compost metagenome]